MRRRVNPGPSADIDRLRAEFLALPGMCLTLAQTARLFAVPEARARTLLDILVHEGFLVHTDTGLYRRPLCSPLSMSSNG
jgi:hypothetical protein